MVPATGDVVADGVKGGDVADCIKEDEQINVKQSIEEALGEFEYDVGEGKCKVL